MSRFYLLLSSLFFAFGPSCAFADQPNIVLIMADDMGYTDIGCYGSEIQTPALDSLAADGVRLTQFYNTSRCCPTRASLLTGLYSHQAGIGLMTGDRGYDAYRGDLNRNCVTIAEALRPAGYASYLSGKWHVTKHTRPEGPKHNWPLQRGFDRFYGTIIGAGSFYDPATLCRGNNFITSENDPGYQPESFYYTDAITDNAITYIRDHFEDPAQSAKPFFLYVSHTSAHWPMHAPENEIQKYDGVYDAGFDAIRSARHDRAIEAGVLNSTWQLTSPAASWERNEQKEWNIRCMEVYAAMVDRMDQGIGRIVEELRERGQLDNTLILYLQDNGGCAEGFGRNSNAEQISDTSYEPLGRDGLQNKIWPPMQTRDGRPVRTGPETMPGSEDTFVAYGTGWANASNTPFRGFKHDGYEGGISTPLIIHWPEGIKEEHRNSIRNQPAHLIDLMPTLLQAAEAEYPQTHDDSAIQPLEGVSLLPLLSGGNIARNAPLCFEHHGNLALREGRWKIVSQYRRDLERKWELFDMDADRTETTDLAAEHPELLNELAGKWQEWADRVGVQTWPFENK